MNVGLLVKMAGFRLFNSSEWGEKKKTGRQEGEEVKQNTQKKGSCFHSTLL
jgi:hypothetical protein